MTPREIRLQSTPRPVLADSWRGNLLVLNDAIHWIRFYRAQIAKGIAEPSRLKGKVGLLQYHCMRYKDAMREIADCEAEMERRGIGYYREVLPLKDQPTPEW